MSNSVLSDIKTVLNLSRLYVAPKRMTVMWVVVIICTLPYMFVQEDFSYTALLLIIFGGVIQQFAFLLRVSDMVESSPYIREIMQRSVSRVTFLAGLGIYLLSAVINYAVAHIGFGHDPQMGSFFGVALIWAIYQVTSPFLYLKRWVSYLGGGLIGGVGAASIISTGDNATPLLGRILPVSFSYGMEVALGVAVIVIGTIVYRLVYRSLWRYAIDKSVFDTWLKRYQSE